MVERTNPVARVWYVGLGSNVGDREGYVQEALRRLDEAPGIEVQAVSSLYETAPWGDPDQGPFLNLVARAVCTLEPHGLLAKTQRIERAVGRRPRRRWGPREIDIDLLLAEDLRVDSPDLMVPHPLIAERQFVLIPLAELDPELQLPDGSTVSSRVAVDGSVRLWRAAGRS